MDGAAGCGQRQRPAPRPRRLGSAGLERVLDLYEWRGDRAQLGTRPVANSRNFQDCTKWSSLFVSAFWPGRKESVGRQDARLRQTTGRVERRSPEALRFRTLLGGPV